MLLKVAKAAFKPWQSDQTAPMLTYGIPKVHNFACRFSWCPQPG
jgi:hypothetical protein